jgi:hypothetical protein
LTEAGYLPFQIDKPTVDLQGLTSTYLSKLIAQEELTDSLYDSYLRNHKVSHLLFWLDANGFPRVGYKAFEIYFPQGIDPKRIVYEKYITDDIYRFTKEPLGPYRLVLVNL